MDNDRDADSFVDTTELSRRGLLMSGGMVLAAGGGLATGSAAAAQATQTGATRPASSTTRAQPRSIGHVGLTVPDLDAAAAWYGDVLGFRLIAPPLTIRKGDGVQTEISTDMFGPDFGGFRIAHLSTGGNTALELFEFIGPAFVKPEREYEPWRGGYSHICVVDPQIDELVAKIQARGGRRRTQIWTMFDAKPDPYRVCICQDPWGSIIEIYTHSSEQSFANQGRM